MDLTNINYVGDIVFEEWDKVYESIVEEFPILTNADCRIGGSLCWLRGQPKDFDLIFRIPEQDIGDDFDPLYLQARINEFIRDNGLVLGKRADTFIFVQEWYERRRAYLEEKIPAVFNQIKNYPEFDIINRTPYNFELNTPVTPLPAQRLCVVFLAPSRIKYEIYRV